MSCALVGQDRWVLLSNAALLRCLGPSLAMTAGGCCTLLSCQQCQCPCGATAIQLAVKNWYLARSLVPFGREVLCHLAVTIAACFLIVVLIVVQPLRTFHTTANINLACLQCLVPLLAKTAGACDQTFVARPRCLAPSLAETAGLAVYGICLPAMSSALIGRDRWGSLSKKMACPQYRCTHGATAIRLAVEKLVACLGSHTLVGCNHCQLAFQ
jgi:hypothetical protein